MEDVSTTRIAVLEAQLAAAKEFESERDRRYAEVNVEKEKALKIKETADLAALQLAREIQTYKDEKANELREQINSERGSFASKDDLLALSDKFETALKPMSDFISAQNAKTENTSELTRRSSVSFNNRLIAMGVTVSSIVVLVNIAFFLLSGH